ncbi:hypothetical protein SprV_0100175000 [Sparganum proliferum]
MGVNYQVLFCFILGVICSLTVKGVIYFSRPPKSPLAITSKSEALNVSRPLPNPRILCYVNTIPATYFTKAQHVKRTWARRCTKVFFFSSKTEHTLPVINLNLTKPESRMHLWSKMRKIVRYVYQYRNEYDYFFKADDDTYLFVENLADELSRRNPDEPFMMGHRFRRFQKDGYFSGGAGYVLSRGALKLLVESAIDKHPTCPTYDEDKEDVKMSVCGVAVGVKLFDALDNLGKNKFNWVSPESTFDKSKWLADNLPSSSGKSQRLLRMPSSIRTISFHYVRPETMYLIEFASRFIRLTRPGYPAKNTSKNEPARLS